MRLDSLQPDGTMDGDTHRFSYFFVFGCKPIEISSSVLQIIPQAVCARYGLAIGAKVAPFVQILVRICFPIAFPVSKVKII